MKSEATKESAAVIPVTDNINGTTSTSLFPVDNEVRSNANEGQKESCKTELRCTSPETPGPFQNRSHPFVPSSSKESGHIERGSTHVDGSDRDDSSEHWRQKCSLLETRIQELEQKLESIADRDGRTVETERTSVEAHRVPSTIAVRRMEDKDCQTDPVSFLSPRSHPARKTKAAKTIQVIRAPDLRRRLSFAPGGLSITYIEITRKAAGRRE